jgi:uncharacterized protein (DUF2267 family)
MPDTVVTEYDYEQFITTIQHKAQVAWDEAELAARSTLATLAERLSAGEARDIAGHSTPTSSFGAWRNARGSPLREAISEKEFDDLFAELPDEFRSLLRGS